MSSSAGTNEYSGSAAPSETAKVKEQVASLKAERRLAPKAECGKAAEPRIHIEHNDCLSFLRTLPEGSVDLIVSDPAYSGMNNRLQLGKGRIVGRYSEKGTDDGKWFREFEDTEAELRRRSVEDLQTLRENITAAKLQQYLDEQAAALSTYRGYEEIVHIFEYIQFGTRDRDKPLLLEWNTWRAFAMLDDGDIVPNFGLDDEGQPLSTAPGRGADILCQYRAFDVLVEVTLSTGATQYMMEGEPVARHVGTHRNATGRETYCVFIANRLHDATLAHFYMLHRTNVKHYGGRAKIIPMSLDDFLVMLKQAAKGDHPNAEHIRALVDYAAEQALEAEDGAQWYGRIVEATQQWPRRLRAA